MDHTVSSQTEPSQSEEVSKFAGVVFHNIQDAYIPGKDIRCCFSIKQCVSTTPDDWIGLYKVGWKSSNEFLTYEYLPELSTTSSLTASLALQSFVCFQGSKLPPSDDCEFYQFCYVTSSGEIRGASCPFQISYSKPGQLEISCEEDDESLLIVKNRTTVLEDALVKAHDENIDLKSSKEKLEADILKFQDMILKLEAKKEELVTENQKLSKLLDKALSEKTNLHEMYNECLEKLRKCESALALAKDEKAEMQVTFDELKAHNSKATSDQQLFEDEKAQLLQLINHRDATIKNFLQTIEENCTKFDALEKENQELLRKIECLSTENANLADDKTKSEESLKKSVEANEELQKSQLKMCEELRSLQEKNSMTDKELLMVRKQAEEEASSYTTRLSALELKHVDECDSLQNQLQKMSSELKESKQAITDSYEKNFEDQSLWDHEKKILKEQIKEFEDSLSVLQEQLAHERAFNNSLSSASDQQLSELQLQLNAQLEKSVVNNKKIEELNQEVRRLKEIIQQNEGEIAKMQIDLSEQTQQLENSHKLIDEKLQTSSVVSETETSVGLEGSHFALKTAHGQLRKQYLQAKKEIESLWRQKADLKRQLAFLQSELPDSDMRFEMANLKKQVEDLRVRLNMGAEAYTAKVKECQKYQKQLRKGQKTSLLLSSSAQNQPSHVENTEIKNPKQLHELEKTTYIKSLEIAEKESKEQLLVMQEKYAVLQQEALNLKKEAKANMEKRLIEDKELQSHIDHLRRQLEAKSEALKEAKRKYEEDMRNAVECQSEENTKIQNALKELKEQNEGLLIEKRNLEAKLEKQNEYVRQLRELDEGVHSCSNHGRDEVYEPNLVDEVSRGSPSSAADSTCDSISSGNQCPVCAIFFPPNCPESDFVNHVNSHFKD